MSDIDTQLRRYADALEATHGPELGRSDGPTPLERRRPDRRRSPLLLVTAALLAVFGVGIWRSSDRAPDVATEAPMATVPSVDEDGARPELGHPRYLPSDQRWVLSTATVESLPGWDGPSSSLWAFRHDDGRLSILTARPGEEADGAEPRSPATAEIERSYNRAVVWWAEGDVTLALMTFDADDRQVRADAEAVERSGMGYALPGATVLASDEDPTGANPSGGYPAGSPGSTMVFTATGDVEAGDGEAGDVEAGDVETITQVSGPGTISDLYATLFEASDLGTVRQLEVDGMPAYVLSQGFDAYGLSLLDDQLVIWQGSSADVDLTGFIGSLEPVDDEALRAALDDADKARRSDVDDAVAAGIPDGAAPELLARLVLDEPWRLEAVYDQSLWTAEQRAEYRVRVDALDSGQVETGRIWFQYFAASADPEDALIALEAREATIRPATITVGSATDRPISILGYDGNLGEFDQQQLISVRKGTTSLEIRSGRLSAAELAAFAERLIDRSGDGLDGFDLTDDEFTTVAEGAAPPATEEEVSGFDEPLHYSAIWTMDGASVRLRVSLLADPAEAEAWPPEEFERADASASGAAPAVPVEGTPFVAMAYPGGTFAGGGDGEILEWENESAGVLVRITGRPDDARRAAAAVRTTDEGHWRERANPFVESFDDAISRLDGP